MFYYLWKVKNEIPGMSETFGAFTSSTPNDCKSVFRLANKNGVGLNVHYIPIYRQPYYSQMGFDFADFPVAEKYYSEAVSIPMYADLTFEQQQHVASVLISTAATVSL